MTVPCFLSLPVTKFLGITVVFSLAVITPLLPWEGIVSWLQNPAQLKTSVMLVHPHVHSQHLLSSYCVPGTVGIWIQRPCLDYDSKGKGFLGQAS